MAEDFNASTNQSCGCDIPRLFPEFEPATYEAWYKEAVASLKGAPFEKKVITKTYEGIDLQPIYWAKDVENLPQRGSLPGYPGYVRSTGYGGYVLKPWDICQEIACSTPEEFNEVATHDLARGQNALKLVLDTPSRKGLDPDSQDGDNGVGKNGLSLSTLEDLGTALRGIDLRTTPLMIHAGAIALPMVVLLAANLQHQNESFSHIRCCVGGDPLEELAREGKLSIDLSTAYDTMATLVAWSENHAPHLQSILVHGSPYHDAGGSAVQELAYVIATGVEYIREMNKRGLSIDAVAPRMRFVFSLGPNFFMEIARLRAARLLWAQVVQVFGGGDEAQKMCIHGRTSAYTKTVYDPYVNILRNTTEAFAGAMGGVDSMHVCSFDEPIRPADEFSRRVSRNMQIILQQEAHFVHPIDPAGGSWYIETLTDSVARKAWEIFQDIEAMGGMTQALLDGKPQKAVAEVAAKKAKSLDTRRDVMVGINMYPNLKEVPLAVPAVDYKALQEQRAQNVQSRRLRSDLFKLYDQLGEFHIGVTENASDAIPKGVRAVLEGATLGDLWSVLTNGGNPSLPVQPLRIHRVSERFEALRRNAETIATEKGSRPRIFMATVGTLASFKPRADFSTALFEVGGFEVLGNEPLENAESAAAAAVASPANIIVICSTDQNYPEVIPPLARAIKDARPETMVLVAGKPPAEMEQTYRDAGVDEFFFMGIDCRQLLSTLQQRS